jgi:8-oxo-dGTP diphosphatase
MSFHPTTQRLILRTPMISDVPAFVEILNDYEVAKNLRMVAHPFNDTLCREALVHMDRMRQDNAGFAFAVTRAMDGALIGLCAVDLVARGIWEFGYWYGRRFWNQGYATEAARPVLRFAFEDMGAERLTAGWYDDNPASGAVLYKLGFTVTGTQYVRPLARGVEVLSNRVLLTREQYVRKKAA